MRGIVKDVGLVIWVIGAILVAGGEIQTALDKKKGNTISEKFWALPHVMQTFVIMFIGIVIGHWVWPRVVEVNIEVKED